MTLQINPPRGRAFSTPQPWSPPSYGGNSNGRERLKNAAENDQQGRLERDTAPLAGGVLTDEARTVCQRRAIDRLIVAELVETIGAALDPTLHGGNPRLANIAFARALREAAERWPDLAGFLDEEIAMRRSARWFSDADEATAASWLGQYQAPPPPPPTRPEHSPAYLAASKRVIDAAYTLRPQVPLAYRDPIDGKAHVVAYVPGADPALPFGMHQAQHLFAQITKGHLLGFVPQEGGRLVPPDLAAVKGASWTAAADGACYLLQLAK
jgi:hypothetical protein